MGTAPGDVSFEDALGVLGVSLDDDDKAIRRAYLRAVKRHPPERDPEGFEHVRRAYDRITQEAAFRRMMAEHGVRFETDTESDASPVSNDDDADPSPDDTPAAAHDGLELDDPLRPYRERLEALGPDPDPKDLAALWREAHAELPGMLQISWALLDALWEAKQDEEAFEIAASCFENGNADLLLNLAAQGPERVNERALTLLEDDDRADVRASLVAICKLWRRPKRATKLALALLKEDSPTIPSAATLLDLVLHHEAKGDRKRAKRLREAFIGYLERTGYERRALAGQESRWMALRQLLRVRDDIPDELFRAFAWALSDGEVGPAVRAARRVPADVAEQVDAVLRRDAPSLHSLVARSIGQPIVVVDMDDERPVLNEDVEPPPEHRENHRAWLPVLFLLVMAVRALASC